MTIADIIKTTLASQPEGDKLLDTITVTMQNVESQYINCMYMQKVVDIKYDLNVLKTTGYTLRQLLDNSSGITHDEIQRFVLQKIQEHIENKKK